MRSLLEGSKIRAALIAVAAFGLAGGVVALLPIAPFDNIETAPERVIARTEAPYDPQQSPDELETDAATPESRLELAHVFRTQSNVALLLSETRGERWRGRPVSEGFYVIRIDDKGTATTLALGSKG